MEKRIFARIKNEIKISYKIMGSSGEGEANTMDISGGGLRLPVYEKVKPETLVELNIFLPSQDAPFYGLAKVIWQSPVAVKGKGGKNFFETGLKFIKVGINNRKQIVRYINSLVKESI
ncbi:MAG: PilZ domain-containing protein [Candidatus Omnitrophota bacterium]